MSIGREWFVLQVDIMFNHLFVWSTLTIVIF